MGFRAFIILILLPAFHNCIAQIDIDISLSKQKIHKIKLDVDVMNKSDTSVVLRNYQKTLDIARLYSQNLLKKIDSCCRDKEYFGFLLLDSTGNPPELRMNFYFKHPPMYSENIKSLWSRNRTSLRRLIAKDCIKILGRSRKKTRVKIKTTGKGFVLPGGNYSLKLVYHLPNSEYFIFSNSIDFKQTK